MNIIEKYKQFMRTDKPVLYFLLFAAVYIAIHLIVYL